MRKPRNPAQRQPRHHRKKRGRRIDPSVFMAGNIVNIALEIARAFFPNLDEFLRDPTWQIDRMPEYHGNWRRVMGFGDFYAPQKQKILTRFKKLARKRHPDVGGSHNEFIELVNARDAALRECRI